MPKHEVQNTGYKNKLRLLVKQFRMEAKIIGYEVWDVMLNIGFNTNILLSKSWEFMGMPNPVFSLIKH